LSGQFSLQNVRSPRRFGPIRRPLAGTPWYRIVEARRSDTFGGAASATVSRSSRCSERTSSGPDCTPVTTIPLPPVAVARSSANPLTPSATNLSSTVASPSISSVSSASDTRKT
jgi:hypothetical protein